MDFLLKILRLVLAWLVVRAEPLTYQVALVRMTQTAYRLSWSKGLFYSLRSLRISPASPDYRRW